MKTWIPGEPHRVRPLFAHHEVICVCHAQSPEECFGTEAIIDPAPPIELAPEIQSWFSSVARLAESNPRLVAQAWEKCENRHRQIFAIKSHPLCHFSMPGVALVYAITHERICKACSGCALSPNALQAAYQQGVSVSETAETASTKSGCLKYESASALSSQPDSNDDARSREKTSTCSEPSLSCIETGISTSLCVEKSEGTSGCLREGESK